MGEPENEYGAIRGFARDVNAAMELPIGTGPQEGRARVNPARPKGKKEGEPDWVRSRAARGLSDMS